MTIAAPGTAPGGGIRDAGHVDALIVGAGVSGIGAAHHMRERFPRQSLLILEGRDGHGGTWWTHRYPGVRSDSDLFTYGYRFQPWRGPAIASGTRRYRADYVYLRKEFNEVPGSYRARLHEVLVSVACKPGAHKDIHHVMNM